MSDLARRETELDTYLALEAERDDLAAKLAQVRDVLEKALTAKAEAVIELAQARTALEDIALYEEPWPQDPSDVYEHFQAVARAALAKDER